MKQNRYLYYILSALALVPYLPLLSGQYIFDDLEFILRNIQLQAIESLWDCFTFQFQPSKPVTNFFLAFSHYIGNGSVAGHRLFSLTLHLLTTLCLFANLSHLCERFELKPPLTFAFWATALFAINPVHSETLAITQFRGEILATLSCLVAILGAQLLRLSHTRGKAIALYAIIFLFTGLSQLSKEVFALITPLAILLVYYLPSKLVSSRRPWRFALVILAMEVVWAPILLHGILSDQTAAYSYAGLIGLAEQTWPTNLQLGTRAWLEALIKLTTGLGLTSIRLTERSGFASLWPTWATFAAFFLSLGTFVFLSLRHRWLMLWLSLFTLSLGLYCFIPNANVGSEHYLYFPTVAWCPSVVFVIWQLCSQWSPKTNQTLPVVIGIYGLVLLLPLENRVWEMRLRDTFYLSEVQKHPEAVSSWVNVADNLLRSRDPNDVVLAKRYLDRAAAIQYDHPGRLGSEFMYYFYTKQFQEAKITLEQLNQFKWLPSTLATFHFNLGILSVMEGKCKRAKPYLNKATQLHPVHPTYRLVYDKLQDKSQRLELCND